MWPQYYPGWFKKTTTRLFKWWAEMPKCESLANEFGATSADFNGLPDIMADIYIIAIADYAVRECLPRFQFNNKLVVHTAGYLSKRSAEGVICKLQYPLQSLRKEIPWLQAIPFLINGNSDDVCLFLESFAQNIVTGCKIKGDEERLKLHVAAVIVSNFTNHLYTIAEDYCNKEHVDFNLLKPLIAETALRIKEISPAAVQTGPALRRYTYFRQAFAPACQSSQIAHSSCVRPIVLWILNFFKKGKPDIITCLYRFNKKV